MKKKKWCTTKIVVVVCFEPLGGPGDVKAGDW